VSGTEIETGSWHLCSTGTFAPSPTSRDRQVADARSKPSVVRQLAMIERGLDDRERVGRRINRMARGLMICFTGNGTTDRVATMTRVLLSSLLTPAVQITRRGRRPQPKYRGVCVAAQ
jgi:hypothetical protein